MSLLSQKNVFWFELAINDALLVKELDSHYDLCNHVPDDAFREEDIWFFGVEEEIAFWKVLHDDVDILLVLEDFEDVGEEGVPADARNQLGLQQVQLLYL